MKSSAFFTKRRIVALTVVSIAIGAAIFAMTRAPNASTESVATATNEIWTCSMHPQVRLPKPGKCPICSMPLIRATDAPKLAADTNAPNASMLQLSDHAREMASVETAVVQKRKLTREVRAVGKVQYNESGLANITTRVEGYAERLFVDYTGAEVKTGEHLVEIYSPDLLVAQQELLVALESARNTNLIESARRKLLLWGLTSQQVDDLVRNKSTTDRVTLFSPITGTVTEKMIVQKAMVKPGEMLYRVANLESVWVYLDIFESDLPWVQYGQIAEIKAEAFPLDSFSGRVWFISPTLNEETRSIKVLLSIDNHDRKLKPGMYVNAVLRSQPLSNGRPAPTGVAGQWTCRMHPLVIQKESGACPVCGMSLVQIPGAPEEEVASEEILAVPITAVLDSGVRKVVYVEKRKGEFAATEIVTGPRTDDAYPVLSGLNEGDTVAIRGGFMIDSQLQIRGMPSLFYREGQSGVSGHQHGTASSAPSAPSHEDHPAPPQHKH